MTAKLRTIHRQWQPTHHSKLSNLLVSGDSFTFNNSETHLCSWPYYLRDLVGFEKVFDCSQSGAGNDHVFNSVIYEIETNPEITPESTMIIVMWSSLPRVDTIADTTQTATYHHMSNYHFDSRLATLSLFDGPGNDALSSLGKRYHKTIPVEARCLVSALKIVALTEYLRHKKFSFVSVSWQDLTSYLDHVDPVFADRTMSSLDPCYHLQPFSHDMGQVETCGHPTPAAYLEWTRQHLIPLLVTKNLIYEL